LGFLVGSGAAQAAGLAVIDALNPPDPAPPATLTVAIEGEGAATIRSLGRAWSMPCVWRDLADWFAEGYCTTTPIADVTCTAQECRYQYPRGHMVVVEANPAKGHYLDGWSSQCQPGDNFGQCTIVVTRGEDIAVFYEKVPDDVDIDTVAMADPDQDIELPEPGIDAALLDEPITMPEPEPLPTVPPEPEIETLPVEPPPQIAQIEPPPPEIPKPQPKPEPQPPAAAPKKQPPKVQMKSVEVDDDENLVKEAPSDAQFLSDKNRDVAEQTHAQDTNLEREKKGDGAYSEKSDVQSEEIGAEETDIAQLEDSEASSLDVDESEESKHSGEDKVAMGIEVGEGGQGGELGDGGDGGDAKQPGALAMRGIEGRGTPGGPTLTPEGEHEGRGGTTGRKGTKGKRGIRTDITFEDYERIVGTDKVEEELEIAKRTKSKKKGRYAKKLARVQSSLENFTPEIKPGNQTALKTRAEPFAVYVARMHRKIHELWGFGFLEELDGKSSTHEMNKWELATKIEIVVNPDGTVDKATIVEHSGVLTFDVAALDTVFTSEPFEATPKEIRSPDGKVYLHWRFHRDWHQCGTFGVDKFIRNDVPAGGDKGSDDAGMFSNRRKNKTKNKGGDDAAEETTAGGGESTENSTAAAARAAAHMPDPDDPMAEKVALAWMTGFEQSQVGEMANASTVPFHSRGQVVANDMNSVSAVYRTILKETSARKITQWRILSPAGYRKMFDTLPSGAEAGTSVFLVVKVKDEMFTLTLQPQGDSTYKVTAFDR
jgi:TonB family protein